MSRWTVLAVDDEPLGLQELVHQLRQDERVADVHGAPDGLAALRMLRDRRVDVVFLDVNMPGLDGIELAGVHAGQVERPAIVFVTAHDGRAAEAFGLDAVDYVLKPLRSARITEALNRVERRRVAAEPVPGPADTELATIVVDDGRRTYIVHRDDVIFAEAHRDYVHLHTRGLHAGTHAVRMPLSVLENAWQAHGFLRVHRSYLIALRFTTELARDPLGGHLVRVAGHDLPVSRRQAAVLRERVRVLSRGSTAGRRG